MSTVLYQIWHIIKIFITHNEVMILRSLLFYSLISLICHVEIRFLTTTCRCVVQNRKTLTSITLYWVVPEKIHASRAEKIENTPLQTSTISTSLRPTSMFLITPSTLDIHNIHDLNILSISNILKVFLDKSLDSFPESAIP